jgi:two-component system, OmpR family, sensor kinase
VKINRLFWKFFAAFWLANIFMMVATTYALLNRVESQRQRDQLQQSLTELVNFIESTGDRHSGQIPRPRLPRPFGGTVIAQMPVIHIFRDNRIWYRYEPKRRKERPNYNFKIISASGIAYEARTLPPRRPRFFAEWLEQKLKFELMLMLLVSAVVSFILSWTVTRPLKQLGASSRRFARGQWQTSIDTKLSARGDEFGELARDMGYMMETVNKTLSAQKQLLHDVSHELRAPLARLQVAAELIQQKDPTNNPQIARIHRECAQIDQLIQRILNFSRMEESAVESDIELIALIGEQVDNTRFENPGHTITFDSDTTVAPYRGFIQLLSQSIENILRNACKYTPPNSPIEIQLKHTEDAYQLSFRDHGKGVAEEDLPRLTEPFYRAGNKMHVSEDVGFGLGLSIVQRTTQKHGGILSLINHPEGGLLITLHLPRTTR